MDRRLGFFFGELQSNYKEVTISNSSKEEPMSLKSFLLKVSSVDFVFRY